MAQSSISSYYRSTRKRAGEDEAIAAKRRKTVSQDQQSLCPFIQPEVSPRPSEEMVSWCAASTATSHALTQHGPISNPTIFRSLWPAVLVVRKQALIHLPPLPLPPSNPPSLTPDHAALHALVLPRRSQLLPVNAREGRPNQRKAPRYTRYSPVCERTRQRSRSRQFQYPLP